MASETPADIAVEYASSKARIAHLSNPSNTAIKASSSEISAAHKILTLHDTWGVGTAEDVHLASRICIGVSSRWGPLEASKILDNLITSSCLVGDRATAEHYARDLHKQFGEDSVRAQLLTKLADGADSASGSMPEVFKQPKALPVRRAVAFHKAHKKPAEAIKSLHEYLKLYSADVDAWMELCALQLELHRTAQAAHCIEEIILLNPNRADMHTYLAQLLIIMAGEGKHSSSRLLEYARLHASEGVRLTEQTNAWALTLLADACLLHVRSTVKQDNYAGLDANATFAVLQDGRLEHVVEHATHFLTAATAPVEGDIATIRKADIKSEDADSVKKSIKLHSFALLSLSRVPAELKSDVDTTAFRFTGVANACLSSANKQRIEAQNKLLNALL